MNEFILLGTASLILGVVVYGLTQTLKKLFPEFWERKWPNRFLSIIPVLFALLLSLIPGWAMLLPTSINGYMIQVWSAAVGFLNSLVYKYVRRRFDGKDTTNPDPDPKPDPDLPV